MREQTALPHEYIYVGRLWNGVTGNFDNNKTINTTIVMHSMAGSMAGTIAHFQNPATVPSATYGIGLDGRLVQFLPESVTSYNAGEYDVNLTSISIEHEDGGNNQIVRPDALYEKSAQLLAEVGTVNGIPLDREHVKLHNEIIATSCPGTLDVNRIIARALQIQQATAVEQPHQYMILPSVFLNMVNKSTEYDDLWDNLNALWPDSKLDLSLKPSKDSNKLVIARFQAELAKAQASTPTATPSNPPGALPTDTSSQETVSAQPVSIWKTDVLAGIKAILARLGGSGAN